MMAECLSLSGVQVKRGGRIILEVESLQISAGAFVGVIGTNGAGKTTLLKAVSYTHLTLPTIYSV